MDAIGAPLCVKSAGGVTPCERTDKSSSGDADQRREKRGLERKVHAAAVSTNDLVNTNFMFTIY